MEGFLWVFCLLVMAAYFLPYFLKGEDVTMRLSDTLTFFPYAYLPPIHCGKVSAPSPEVVEQMLCGLPRGCFRGELDGFMCLIRLLGCFRAIVAQKMIFSGVAFTGMYLLLGRHVTPEPEFRAVVMFVSLGFGILPFHLVTSVHYVPLIMAAFLDIGADSQSWWAWAALLLVPFNSPLFLSGVFVAAAGWGYAVYVCATRGIDVHLLLAAAVYSAGYVAKDYRLFYETLIRKSYVSVRVVNDPPAYVDMVSAPGRIAWLDTSIQALFRGTHASLMYPFPVMIATVAAGILIETVSGGRGHLATFLLLLMILAVMAANFLTGTRRGWQLAAPLVARVGVKPHKVQYLCPVVWYVMFCISLHHVWTAAGAGLWICLSIALTQCVLVFLQNETLRKEYSITFRSFYAEKLFGEIARRIGPTGPASRVASIGMYPVIPIYNGLYTIDGFVETYPLGKFLDFQEMQRGEAARDGRLAAFMNSTGSCFVFPAELEVYRMYLAGNGREIRELRLDYDMMRDKMNCRHVLSAVRINEKNHPRLRRVDSFTHPEAAWEVHVYELLPADAPPDECLRA